MMAILNEAGIGLMPVIPVFLLYGAALLCVLMFGASALTRNWSLMASAGMVLLLTIYFARPVVIGPGAAPRPTQVVVLADHDTGPDAGRARVLADHAAKNSFETLLQLPAIEPVFIGNPSILGRGATRRQNAALDHARVGAVIRITNRLGQPLPPALAALSRKIPIHLLISSIQRPPTKTIEIQPQPPTYALMGQTVSLELGSRNLPRTAHIVGQPTPIELTVNNKLTGSYTLPEAGILPIKVDFDTPGKKLLRFQGQAAGNGDGSRVVPQNMTFWVLQPAVRILTIAETPHPDVRNWRHLVSQDAAIEHRFCVILPINPNGKPDAISCSPAIGGKTDHVFQNLEDAYDIIVLPGLTGAALPLRLQQAIADFAQRGGALLVTTRGLLSPQMAPELRAILPALPAAPTLPTADVSVSTPAYHLTDAGRIHPLTRDLRLSGDTGKIADEPPTPDQIAVVQNGTALITDSHGQPLLVVSAALSGRRVQLLGDSMSFQLTAPATAPATALGQQDFSGALMAHLLHWLLERPIADSANKVPAQSAAPGGSALSYQPASITWLQEQGPPEIRMITGEEPIYGIDWIGVSQPPAPHVPRQPGRPLIPDWLAVCVLLGGFPLLWLWGRTGQRLDPSKNYGNTG